MDNLEKTILENLKKAIPKLDDEQLERLVCWTEGIAYAADHRQASAEAVSANAHA